MYHCVIGKGGHSSIVKSILESKNIVADYLNDYEIKYSEMKEYHIAIGNNEVRHRIAKSLPTMYFFNVIHEKSYMDNTKLGFGILINAGVIVQPGCRIGNHTIINTNSSIDHDCDIGNFVHIAPGCTICGNVEIGDMSFIGAGATIINNVTIGRNVTIGAGSVVLKDIPDNSKAYGVPCKIVT